MYTIYNYQLNLFYILIKVGYIAITIFEKRI